MRVGVLVLTAVPSGCGPRVERFDERFAKAWCERAWGCMFGDVSPLFGTEEACELSLRDHQAAVTACRSGECRFDSDAAGHCLRDLESSTCAAFRAGEADAACREIWTDCEETEGLCLGLEHSGGPP